MLYDCDYNPNYWIPKVWPRAEKQLREYWPAIEIFAIDLLTRPNIHIPDVRIPGEEAESIMKNAIKKY